MEPECPLCGEDARTCNCDPDKVRICVLERDLKMLREAIGGWWAENELLAKRLESAEAVVGAARTLVAPGGGYDEDFDCVREALAAHGERRGEA